MVVEPRFSAFVYGTLLHPEILQRVICNDGSHLDICPAVLLDHTRHKVKNEDYPGILPYSKSRLMLDHDLRPEERSVRGTLVLGLSKADVDYLDVFEGDEYIRVKVQVHPLSPIVPLPSCKASSNQIPDYFIEKEPSDSLEKLALPVECETYIWALGPEELTKEPWSLHDFFRLDAWKWIPGESEGSTGRPGYLEVDKRREMEGKIVRTPPQERSI